ncbi:ankyrin repeat domain-containing protein, partial [bacterium]
MTGIFGVSNDWHELVVDSSVDTLELRPDFNTLIEDEDNKYTSHKLELSNMWAASETKFFVETSDLATVREDITPIKLFLQSRQESKLLRIMPMECNPDEKLSTENAIGVLRNTGKSSHFLFIRPISWERQINEDKIKRAIKDHLSKHTIQIVEPKDEKESKIEEVVNVDSVYKKTKELLENSGNETKIKLPLVAYKKKGTFQIVSSLFRMLIAVTKYLQSNPNKTVQIMTNPGDENVQKVFEHVNYAWLPPRPQQRERAPSLLSNLRATLRKSTLLKPFMSTTWNDLFEGEGDNKRLSLEKIQKKPNNWTLKSSDDETVLMIAAKEGNEEIARAALENKMDIDAQDAIGYTALHTAAYYGQVEVARMLLLREVPNLIAKEDGDNNTAFDIAVFENKPVIVEFLLKHKVGGKDAVSIEERKQALKDLQAKRESEDQDFLKAQYNELIQLLENSIPKDEEDDHLIPTKEELNNVVDSMFSIQGLDIPEDGISADRNGLFESSIHKIRVAFLRKFIKWFKQNSSENWNTIIKNEQVRKYIRYIFSLNRKPEDIERVVLKVKSALSGDNKNFAEQMENFFKSTYFHWSFTKPNALTLGRVVSAESFFGKFLLNAFKLEKIGTEAIEITSKQLNDAIKLMRPPEAEALSVDEINAFVDSMPAADGLTLPDTLTKANISENLSNLKVVLLRHYIKLFKQNEQGGWKTVIQKPVARKAVQTIFDKEKTPQEIFGAVTKLNNATGDEQDTATINEFIQNLTKFDKDIQTTRESDYLIQLEFGFDTDFFTETKKGLGVKVVESDPSDTYTPTLVDAVNLNAALTNIRTIVPEPTAPEPTAPPVPVVSGVDEEKSVIQQIMAIINNAKIKYDKKIERIKPLIVELKRNEESQEYKDAVSALNSEMEKSFATVKNYEVVAGQLISNTKQEWIRNFSALESDYFTDSSNMQAAYEVK